MTFPPPGNYIPLSCKVHTRVLVNENGHISHIATRFFSHKGVLPCTQSCMSSSAYMYILFAYVQEADAHQLTPARKQIQERSSCPDHGQTTHVLGQCGGCGRACTIACNRSVLMQHNLNHQAHFVLENS